MLNSTPTSEDLTTKVPVAASSKEDSMIKGPFSKNEAVQKKEAEKEAMNHSVGSSPVGDFLHLDENGEVKRGWKKKKNRVTVHAFLFEQHICLHCFGFP